MKNFAIEALEAAKSSLLSQHREVARDVSRASADALDANRRLADARNRENQIIQQRNEVDAALVLLKQRGPGE